MWTNHLQAEFAGKKDASCYPTNKRNDFKNRHIMVRDKVTFGEMEMKIMGNKSS
jgi:hypothetical protein